MIPREVSLLRLYSSVLETWRGRPLYRAVVEAARRLGVGGASVFPVVMGYGTHRALHDIASEYASVDLPIVIEVVDGEQRIGALGDELDAMVGEGLVVIRPARVHRYTHAEEPAARPGEVSREEGDAPMNIEGPGQRVSVYIGSADTWNGQNLAAAIVERCRAMGMAGATVTRGVMGFGKHSVIHKAHLLGLSDDLPEKVEVVDRPEAIARLLPALDEMIGGGLIVVEDVHVVRYSPAPKAAPG